MKANKVRLKYLSSAAVLAGIVCFSFALWNVGYFGGPTVWVYKQISPDMVLNRDYNFPIYWIVLVMCPSIITALVAYFFITKSEHYDKESKETEPKDSPMW